MANPKTSGGALDIHEDQVTGHISDAELKGGKPEDRKEDAGEASAAPRPVENFNLPEGEVGGRIFQNGDTDPGDGRSD